MTPPLTLRFCSLHSDISDRQILLYFYIITIVLPKYWHTVMCSFYLFPKKYSRKFITTSFSSSFTFLGGQFASPQKLMKAGFVFSDTDLKDTITRILK